MMTPEQQRPVTFAAVREILDAASRSHKQTREGRRAEKAANAALASAKETTGAKERQAWLNLASLEAETARREAERANT